MRIFNNIGELVGNTPLVRLSKIGKNYPAEIVVKIEYLNPGLSVKDRVAFAMLEKGEEDGFIDHETVIIESTSGNTGIGLALACAIKNYRLILTMPESMSIERRQLIEAYGAEIILTPAAEGMAGAAEKVKELARKFSKVYIPKQFENPANPGIHRTSTALEIWNDTDGKIDILVAGVGTGGTISGISEKIKSLKPALWTVAVEPETSAVLSGEKAGAHKIQGIGAGFIPENLNRDIIDEIVRVGDQDSIRMAGRLAREEGLLCGISSGAVLLAALEVAKREENRDKMIVVILPDTGHRYLSAGIFANK